VFKHWVLRKRFGLKREEVTGGWTDLHRKNLHETLGDKEGRACGTSSSEDRCYRVLVGKPV
jgi:hypothetical protein